MTEDEEIAMAHGIITMPEGVANPDGLDYVREAMARQNEAHGGHFSYGRAVIAQYGSNNSNSSSSSSSSEMVGRGSAGSTGDPMGFAGPNYPRQTYDYDRREHEALIDSGTATQQEIRESKWAIQERLGQW